MAKITLSEHAPTGFDDPLEFRAPNGDEGGVEFSIAEGGSFDTDDPYVLRYAADSVLLDVEGDIPAAPAIAVESAPELAVAAEPVVETDAGDGDFTFFNNDGDN